MTFKKQNFKTKKKKYKINFFSSKNIIFNGYKYYSLGYFINAIIPFINIKKFMLKTMKTNFLYNDNILNFKTFSFTDKINYKNVKYQPLGFLKYILRNLQYSYSFLNVKNNYLEHKRLGDLDKNLKKYYLFKFLKIKDLHLNLKLKKIIKYKKKQFIISNKNFLFILKYKNYLKKKIKNLLLSSFFFKNKFEYNSLCFSKNTVFSNFFFKKNSVKNYILNKSLLFEKFDKYKQSMNINIRFLKRRRLSARKKVSLRKFLFKDLRNFISLKTRKHIYNDFNDKLEYNIKIINNKSYFYKFFYFSKTFNILKQRFKNSYFFKNNKHFSKNMIFINNISFQNLNIENTNLSDNFFFNKI